MCKVSLTHNIKSYLDLGQGYPPQPLADKMLKLIIFTLFQQQLYNRNLCCTKHLTHVPQYLGGSIHRYRRCRMLARNSPIRSRQDKRRDTRLQLWSTTLTPVMVFLCFYMALYLNLQCAVIWNSKHHIVRINSWKFHTIGINERHKWK